MHHDKDIDIGVQVPVFEGQVPVIGFGGAVGSTADTASARVHGLHVPEPMTLAAYEFMTENIVADAEDHVEFDVYRVRGATATKVADGITAADTVAWTAVAGTIVEGEESLQKGDYLYGVMTNESGSAVDPGTVAMLLTGTGKTHYSPHITITEARTITGVNVEAPAAVADAGSHVVVSLYRVRSAAETLIYKLTSSSNFVADTVKALASEGATNGTFLQAGDRLYAKVQQLTGADITPGSWHVKVATKLGLEPATTEYSS